MSYVLFGAFVLLLVPIWYELHHISRDTHNIYATLDRVERLIMSKSSKKQADSLELLPGSTNEESTLNLTRMIDRIRKWLMIHPGYNVKIQLIDVYNSMSIEVVKNGHCKLYKIGEDLEHRLAEVLDYISREDVLTGAGE